MFLAFLVQLSAAIAAFRAVAYAISAQLIAASRMTDSKARTKRVEGRGHIAPALVRCANLVVMKVGLMLAAVFVVLSIGMTFYYRDHVLALFLKRTISNSEANDLKISSSGSLLVAWQLSRGAQRVRRRDNYVVAGEREPQAIRHDAGLQSKATLAIPHR